MNNNYWLSKRCLHFHPQRILNQQHFSIIANIRQLRPKQVGIKSPLALLLGPACIWARSNHDERSRILKRKKKNTATFHLINSFCTFPIRLFAATHTKWIMAGACRTAQFHWRATARKEKPNVKYYVLSIGSFDQRSGNDLRLSPMKKGRRSIYDYDVIVQWFSSQFVALSLYYPEIFLFCSLALRGLRVAFNSIDRVHFSPGDVNVCISSPSTAAAARRSVASSFSILKSVNVLNDVLDFFSSCTFT